jgi:hypothetical protein
MKARLGKFCAEKVYINIARRQVGSISERWKGFLCIYTFAKAHNRLRSAEENVRSYRVYFHIICVSIHVKDSKKKKGGKKGFKIFSLRNVALWEHRAHTFVGRRNVQIDDEGLKLVNWVSFQISFPFSLLLLVTFTGTTSISISMPFILCWSGKYFDTKVNFK